MLRIVHYLPNIRLIDGGVVRAVLDLCAVMARRGHAVTLACCDPRDVPADWNSTASPAPQVVILDPPKRTALLGTAAMGEVRQLVAGADVIHLHELWLVSNQQWARVCRQQGKPYISTLHGMLDDWAFRHRHAKKRLFLWLFARRFLARAARVHSTARGELGQASRWFRNDRVTVLPLLLDLQPFLELPGPERAMAKLSPRHASASRLLFLGRLHQVKRVELLLRATAALRDRGADCVCLIAGTGDADYEAHLRGLVQELRLADQVVFTGAVSGEEKLSLYQAADVFVLPSLQENFGMVLVEALACGTPVVTTRGVDIWEEIQEAGAKIAEPAVEAFAAAIQDVLESQRRGENLGALGRAWVLKTMDPPRLATAYEQMYEEACRHVRDGR